ncbi:MAG: M56 family metallopeptidase, partial [Acidobacteriia bacterium]|nr:M56 family metallopeptidase [Terriglobia bacterium]
KVRGVLAHESAHIRRRDPLIALLANLNRSVFWFHPLAWWLGRQVAIAAEHACDEAGARAMGEGRRYAEVLLEMAEAVRARGGRLVWQGVGMEGAGPLENRINRLLRGDAFQRVSRLRKSIAGLCCAAAIFVAAACRTQPGALVDDPQIKASLANSAEEMFPSIRGLTAGDIAQLEEALRKNPDDLRTRGRLLLFYATRGEQVFGREKTIEARRPHVLWLIEHHPEDSMHGYARLFNEADRLPDPVGYAEARPLWLAQAGRSDASAAALNNAARFFEAAEPKLSEEFLIRARADDPNGRGATNLGWFYARVLSGTILGFLNPTEVDTPFAREIRAKLALSSDAELLLATGQALGYSSRQQAALTDLGKSYVERALHLDAHSLPARRVLVGRRHEEHRLKMWQVCPKLATDLACPAVYSLPESEQLVVLPLLAEVAFDRGDMDRKVAERRSRAAADWDHARKYAEAARQVAERFRGDPDCGTTLYTADLALGLVALQNGDPKTAQKMLLEASEAPPSEELSYYYNSLDYRLPARLLRTGDERGVVPYLERFIGMKPDNQELVQTVATYLDRMAEVRVDNANLIESAALIRAGHRPVWYFKY